MNGPTWLGSWEGQSMHDICSSLTRIDAAHWISSSEVCKELIARKIKASAIGIISVLTLAVTWTSLQACAHIGVHWAAKRCGRSALIEKNNNFNDIE
jgi:hypothetical protein